MFKKKDEFGKNTMPQQGSEAAVYSEGGFRANEVAFSEIKHIIDSANTKEYGFESAILEFILCRFIQFGEDNQCDTLVVFRKLFTHFSIHEHFEFESRVDIVLNLFEYIHVVRDVFLPHFTAENFVKIAVSDYLKQKHQKDVAVSLRFVVH